MRNSSHNSSSAFPERVLFSEICIDGKEDISCAGDNKKEPCLVIIGVGYSDFRVNILMRNLSKSVGSDSVLKRWALLSLASPTRIRPSFFRKGCRLRGLHPHTAAVTESFRFYEAAGRSLPVCGRPAELPSDIAERRPGSVFGRAVR